MTPWSYRTNVENVPSKFFNNFATVLRLLSAKHEMGFYDGLDFTGYTYYNYNYIGYIYATL